MGGPYGPWYEESHIYPSGSYTVHTPWVSPHRIIHHNGGAAPPWSSTSRGSFENNGISRMNHLPDSSVTDRPAQTTVGPLHSTPLVVTKSHGIPVGIQVDDDSRQTLLPEMNEVVKENFNISGNLSEGFPFLIKELGSAKDLNKEVWTLFHAFCLLTKEGMFYCFMDLQIFRWQRPVIYFILCLATFHISLYCRETIAPILLDTEEY